VDDVLAVALLPEKVKKAFNLNLPDTKPEVLLPDPMRAVIN
jgi:hypothetical protein